jgi:predicted DCC family thiol-disulfide oxidoreductase YuxK
MASGSTNLSGDWLVLYDPDCGFCRWSLGVLLALDRRRRLLPVKLGSVRADQLLSDLNPERRAASWHLVSPAGQRWSAGAALAPAARLLPGGRLPAALFARAPKLSERGYAWVAEHRGLLGRGLPSSAKRRATRRIAARGRAGDERQAAASSGRCSAR